MRKRCLRAGLGLVLLLIAAFGAADVRAVQGYPMPPRPLPAGLARDRAQGEVIPRAYLPLISRGFAPPEDRNDVPAYVNYVRTVAGSPPIAFDEGLNANCSLHARYMAEEDHITHDERPDSPWYTPEGQICAQKSNAWMGGASSAPIWEPRHSIEGWLAGPGHRMWLLYPTTTAFGYGFYTASNHRAAAALDVLSRFDSSADTRYPDWPVRYPGPGQTQVPSVAYPITINWRYFGPKPTVSATGLRVEGGGTIAHSITTDLPVGHKGIEIRPDADLPARSTVVVSVRGTYDGTPFAYSWSFTTGD